MPTILPEEASDPVADLVSDGVPRKPRSATATFSWNSGISVLRLLITSGVALILPAFLTHRLPVQIYSAWVLILQMSAYVGYLDFGVQGGISKYVAEYEARNDPEGSSMRASAGMVIMLAMSTVGVLLTLVLAWHVPHIFGEMPPPLIRGVRIALVLVGVSLSFNLLCSICSSIFLGLQRFAVPMVLSLVSRLMFTGVVLATVFLHSGLAVMGAGVAVVNVISGLMQIVAWRRLASRVRLTLRGLDPIIIRRMLAYCSSLAVWSVGMLCVSGLDVTIVGRYDYGQTAFYSIAALPTTFMISMLGAALGPLLPTASALSVHRSPVQMGDLLARVTRYASTLLVLSSLPLLVGGYLVLRLWVGAAYAGPTLGYLRILVLANVVRNTCMPYASMLMATDSQRVAIIGASAEAVVNLTASIYLARHIGAIGVAYGTLLGAFVSVGMHFAISMSRTFRNFSITRLRLFLNGMLRPAAMGIPSLLLVRHWWFTGPPAFDLRLWTLWAVGTLLIAWFAALGKNERQALMGFVAGLSGRLRKVQ